WPACAHRPRAEGTGADPRREVGAQLLGTLLGAAGHGPLLHELRRELRRVVGVREGFGLGQRGLAVLVDVDVVVERAAQRRWIATLLAGHALDDPELPPELLRRELVGHPAVGVARHAAQAALDSRAGGAGAALPRQRGRVGRDPDRTRLLDRSRQEAGLVELIEATGVAG